MTQKQSQKELPLDRLATMDERGHRVFLHPTDTQGKYKRRRKVFHTLLLVLFLVLPWIEINGNPAVLLDLAQRRFSIFGLAFWAHDAPMLIFVAGAIFFGVSLATAVWGRIWCGWSCPETVFVESVYRQIERWIEGNAIQRRRLDASPWNGTKLLRRGGKWLAFLAVTLVISHSFLAYFVGIDALAEMVRQNPAEHPGTFGVMAFMTATLLFFFGWFREQFCVIMCPYGRFQAVLLDEHSKLVAYDATRGEPRRGSKVAQELLQVSFEAVEFTPEVVEAVAPKLTGDCIDCGRCVTACPTGMDIRRGLQLECVNCMACVDACDEVMTNLKQPTGLIKYTSQNELQGKPVRHLRTRVVLLSLALTGVFAGLGYVMLTRPPIKATVFNAKTTPYQFVDAKAKDPVLSNQFFMMASNYTFEDGEVRIEVDNPQVEVLAQSNPMPLKAGEEKKEGIFLKFPKSTLSNGKARIKMFLLTQSDNGKWQRTLTQEVPLVGPY
ncbi:MAG: cytochrome c oxidase accessory protein CcoG [Candidatus Melainabacteria bacterium HGW-Melainabacteria-1]|nr:MAG: cytochrome c oxidase accessory protein CcoG [Candidatus Melainabacteria bacterium HGW-Melainabacteria-1]